MSTRSQAGRTDLKLRAFRLYEVPLHVRSRAALTLRRVLADDLGPERPNSPRLYGRSASTGERWAALDIAVEVTRRALFPTDRIYRVSEDAWDRMAARAEGRGRGGW